MKRSSIHQQLKELEHQIFGAAPAQRFEQLALKVFEIQSRENEVYRRFLSHLGINPTAIQRLADIPFLPVSLFKGHKVMLKNFPPQKTFESSSTSATGISCHPVYSLDLYERALLAGFEQYYGSPKDYAFLCLLPSYLERQHASLVYMMEYLCRQSPHPQSGFFLYDHQKLHHTLLSLEGRNIQTLLFGVSFALLDFCQSHPIDLNHTLVMETGGMKGRRKELIREDLHHRLKAGLGLGQIASEYGMTELLSQAYAQKDGVFRCPSSMCVLPRDTQDPLQPADWGQTAGLNVIDLANLYSCSFIATDDLGKVYSDGSFEVLGRFDSSQVRGCNLLHL